jgi:uncharacterized membrane protein
MPLKAGNLPRENDPLKTSMRASMRNVKLFSLQISCAVLATAIGTLTLDLTPTASQNLLSSVQIGKAAIAISSGGRSGGGSFRRSSPSGGSSGGSFQGRPSYGGGGGYVPVPVPYGGGYGGGYGYQSGIGNAFSSLLVLLLLGGLGIAGLMWFLPKMRSGGFSSSTSEVDNNVFAVSKVQIGLYAQARELQSDFQSDLTQLSLDVDTGSSEGLLRLLQESALAMLRNTEYWTHVSASSQIARDALEAEQMVNKLSIEQRRQLSSETLVNVGGSKQRTALKAPSSEEGPAAYIVVTFLVGTAHDKPLFDKIRSVDELKNVLEMLAALPADYLMTFELIWSPQDASDSLTDEELLTEYSDLVQI